MRRENKQKRVREYSHGRGLSANYLEPDRDEEGEDGSISLSAIKNRFKRGNSPFPNSFGYHFDSWFFSKVEVGSPGGSQDGSGGSL